MAQRRAWRTAWLGVAAGLVFAAGVIAAPAQELAGADAAARAALDRALGWVTRNSTYRAIPLRRWETIKAEDMAARAWWMHVAADPKMVFAMYSCAYHTLYFRRDADFDDPVVFSFLIHEVVHHLQCESESVGIDLCAWEREAYGIQDAYLRAVLKGGATAPNRLSAAQMSAARTTADDLGNRAKSACTALQRR